MPNTWIHDTENLFASLDMETNAQTYVETHRESLQAQFDASIQLLSRPNTEDSTNKALALSEQERKCYALCQLAIAISKNALQSNTDSVTKEEHLRAFITQHFKKTNIGAFWASIKSDSLCLMIATESLGRLNLTDGMASTSASYDALLTRLTCEALHPRFVRALYKAFLSDEKLLTPAEQRQAAKTHIQHYLLSNRFHEFSRVMLEYVDLANWIGDQPASMLSLFNTEADSDIRTGILALVQKHPILLELQKNASLTKLNSPTQVLQAIEVFSVLASYPYSMTSPDSKPTPKTVTWISALQPESYQTYEYVRQDIKKRLNTLYSLVHDDFSHAISIDRLFAHTTDQTLAKVFHVYFSGIHEAAEIPTEVALVLAETEAEIQTIFALANSRTNHLPCIDIPVTAASSSPPPSSSTSSSLSSLAAKLFRTTGGIWAITGPVKNHL